MTDINNKSRAELEAMLAEVQAALAAKDDEPWQAASTAFWDEYTRHPGAAGSTRVALQAALRLAPAEPVDVEALTREVAAKRGITGASNLVSIRADDYRSDLEAAIRATLSRGARWPGEMRPLSELAPNEYVLFVFPGGSSRDTESPNMAVGKLCRDADIWLTAMWAGTRADDDPIGWYPLPRRLRAHMTGEQA